jgi:hypothetical protein
VSVVTSQRARRSLSLDASWRHDRSASLPRGAGLFLVEAPWHAPTVLHTPDFQTTSSTTTPFVLFDHRGHVSPALPGGRACQSPANVKPTTTSVVGDMAAPRVHVAAPGGGALDLLLAAGYRRGATATTTTTATRHGTALPFHFHPKGNTPAWPTQTQRARDGVVVVRFLRGAAPTRR